MLRHLRPLLLAATGSFGASANMPNPSPATVIGFGDSWTFGNLASTAAKRYLNLMAAALGGATLTNKGVSGTFVQNTGSTANNGRDRFVADLVNAIALYGYYIIPYGYNDARENGVDNPAMTVALFDADMREILNGMREYSVPPDRIVLLGIPYISDQGLLTGSAPEFIGQTRPGFLTYRDKVPVMATDYGTRYKDMYAYMLANGGDTLTDPSTGGDYIHMGDVGHGVFAVGALTAAITNTNPLPSIAGSSAVSVINMTITPPVGGPAVTDYTIERSVDGTFAYTNTATVAGPTASFTGVADGLHRVRVRANFADATKSPWAFSTRIIVEAATTYFLYDTFFDIRDTDITAHVPEVGGGYVQANTVSGSTPLVIGGDRGLISQGSGGVMHSTGAPASSDHYVEGTFKWFTTIAGENVGVATHMQAAANTYISATYSEAAGGFRLFKTIAGTATQIGSTFASVFHSGTRIIRITISGSTGATFTATMAIDGVDKASGLVVDVGIQAAGFAGIRDVSANASATGIHMTLLRAA